MPNSLTFSSRFAVDFIINPDKEVARDVMRYLLQGGTLHIEQFARRVGLVEYPVSFRSRAGRVYFDRT